MKIQNCNLLTIKNFFAQLQNIKKCDKNYYINNYYKLFHNESLSHYSTSLAVLRPNVFNMRFIRNN